MDFLLIVFSAVLIITIIPKTRGQQVHLNGSYEFLPYEELTDEILEERLMEIVNAKELKLERFSISTLEILIDHLNNTSIEKLYLHDITFDLGSLSRADELGKKIYLPKIKIYKIFVRNVELENESEKNFEMLRKFLLVKKHKKKYYRFVVQLGSKIYIKIHDDDSDSYCQLRYFPPLPANEFECKRIEVSKQSIDLTTLPQRLTQLYLYDGYIYQTTTNSTRNQLTYVHDILKYLPKLSDLVIIYSNPPNSQITFDLSYLLRGLAHFRLSYAKVVNTKSYEKEHRVDINKFRCEHCEFEIRNYSNLRISTPGITLINNYYKTPDGFQKFISSIRNVKYLTLDETYDFDLEWLNGTTGNLEDITLKNLNYQQPKLSLIFPNVVYIYLVNINVIQLESSLSHAFPNLEDIVTTDTNPDLIRMLSGNKKLSEITRCFPKMGLTGTNSSAEPRDFNYITYERIEDSWTIKEDDGFSPRGIPYKVQQYIQFYIWTIFIISSIGLVGNVLIIVMYGRQKPRSSTSYIIISLAFHDSLILILTEISLIYFQVKLMMDEEPISYGWLAERTEGNMKNLRINEGFSVMWYKVEITPSYLDWLFNLQSKWIYPLSKAAYFGAIYTTVLLTLERYVAICFPFRVKDYFNVKSVRAYLMIFGILSISLFAVKGLESFYSNEYFQHVDRSCGTLYIWERSTSSKNPLNYRLYRLLFQEIFWNAVMYFIPIPLLLGLNYKIYREIRKSAALRARSHTNHDQATLQITTMLVCVSLVFVICNSISGSIVWYHVINGADHLADVEIYSCLPLVVNSSVNFIIYSVLGKKIRQEFKKGFGEIWTMLRKFWGNVCCQVVGVRRRQQQPTIGHSIVCTENYELTLQ